MDSQYAELIEEHVRHLLAMMGFSDARVRCVALEEGEIRIDIDGKEYGRLLIGTAGTHLIALQHIIRIVLRHHIKGEAPRIFVDVNGYRTRREQSLLELAKETAQKANDTGQTVMLSPMTAADRRAIHKALAEYEGIKTESLGQEPNRRVVVKPTLL